MDARGVRGPDITQVWASGRTDEGLFKTIRNGVPGTEMPAFSPRTSDHEVVADPRVPAHAGRAGADRSAARQRRERREDLPRQLRELPPRERRRRAARARPVARRRRRAARDVLVPRIRGGVEDFRAGYEPVTLTPPDGQPIRGVKKNEDLFSVQIMDTRERIQGYEKDKVRAVVERHAVRHAGLRPRSSERKRPRRSRSLSADAARVRSGGAANKETSCASTILASRSDRLLAARRSAPPALVAQQAPPPPRWSRRRRLLDGLPADGSRWLTFGGNYANQRHSPLTQITPDERQPAACRSGRSRPARSATSKRRRSLRDNVLYVTGPQNVAWAIDARTGRQIWRYRRELPHGPDGLLRPRQPRLRRARRQAVHDHARRAPARARHEDRRRRLGRDDGGLQARATPRRSRRSSSRTRSSSASPAASTASAASSTPTTRRPASARGASTRFPGRASPATTRGRATRGRPAAPASG